MAGRQGYSVRSITHVGICLALLVISSKITIPTPAIQFTLQTFAVGFSALFLGPKLGALTQTLFLTLGLIGLPVFSGGGGPAYIFRPSFGYLLAFIPASFLIGTLFARLTKHKARFAAALTACSAGLALIYLVGTLYFYILGHVYLGLGAQPWHWYLIAGAIMFLPTDLLSLATASFVISSVRPLSPAWLASKT